MNKNIELLAQRFEALASREKQMMVAALLIGLWGVWDKTLHQPLQKRQQATRLEIKNLETSLNNKQNLAEQFQKTIGNDPNASHRDKLNQLQQAFNHLQQQFSSGDKRFVPPLQMAQALQDMLKQHSKVRLLKLTTLPATSFGNTEQQPAWLYRHGLELTLQGDFFNTLQYLKGLESLPWRIHWDSIDYQVKEHPMAETRIQVYTLSFEQDWLGV